MDGKKRDKILHNVIIRLGSDERGEEYLSWYINNQLVVIFATITVYFISWWRFWMAVGFVWISVAKLIEWKRSVDWAGFDVKLQAFFIVLTIGGCLISMVYSSVCDFRGRVSFEKSSFNTHPNDKESGENGIDIDKPYIVDLVLRDGGKTYNIKIKSDEVH